MTAGRVRGPAWCYFLKQPVSAITSSRRRGGWRRWATSPWRLTRTEMAGRPRTCCTALELGRSGAPLSAVVSFHGGLAAPKPEDARNIRAKVLVCHAAEDTLVPPEQVAAFEAQMRDTKVDWQLCVYGGAVHSFTNPDADKLGNPAFGYNAAADRRSWAAMLSLFEEAFGGR